MEYSKRSRYDEYTSLVMQWSNSAATKVGDSKIFCKKAGDYRLLKADGEGGYVEIARGNYRKVEKIYAEIRRGTDGNRADIHTNTRQFRSKRGGNNGGNSNNQNGGANGQNSGQTGGETVQGDNTGSDEHNRSGDRRESVKNQFSLRSYSDSEYLKADGNGGYVEIARGTYKKVREIDERTFHESKKDFDRYVEERRNEQGRYSGDYEFYENGENDGQSDGRVDSKLSGNNIGGSNENSLPGDRRESVKNQFSLRSYT
ncbi:MAG: hypothetical protein ACI4XH_07200, partial [Acutalibacteraceae bacterium]